MSIKNVMLTSLFCLCIIVLIVFLFEKLGSRIDENIIKDESFEGKLVKKYFDSSRKSVFFIVLDNEKEYDANIFARYDSLIHIGDYLIKNKGELGLHIKREGSSLIVYPEYFGDILTDTTKK